MAYMMTDGNFFPAALPNDGMMDLICIDASIGPVALTRSMLKLDKQGSIFDDPHIWYRKIEAFRLIPREKDGYISVDGERVPFEPLQAEVHRGLATVLSRSGSHYETSGF